MPRITFYTHVAERETFICRLAKRVCDAGQNVLIWCEDDTQLDTLDRLLWTHDAESFLPHQIGLPPQALPDDVPIVLAAADALPHLPADCVVINLTDAFWHQAPNIPARILEIVGASEVQLAAARLRFAAYKQHGFELEHHNMQGKA